MHGPDGLPDLVSQGLQHHPVFAGVQPGDKVAIYMGMGRLREIVGGLLAGGLAPDTAAAIVQWASLGRQRSVVATAAPEKSAEPVPMPRAKPP